MIRIVKDADAARIAEIYNHYILNTLVTFEEQPVTPEEILARIKSITTEYPWLMYEEDGRVVGYAYATRWKERRHIGAPWKLRSTSMCRLPGGT